MELCLVRHGETDWNKEGRLQGRTDIPLNEAGKVQAEITAAYLQTFEYDLIITSPLARAKETAEIIATFTQLALLVNDSLVERSFGEAEGLTPNEIQEKFPNGHIPNEESRDALKMRVMDAINKIRQLNKTHKKIIIVAHGAVINSILYVISEGRIGTGITRLNNTCLSTIVYEKNAWQIQNYNETAHLRQ